LPSGRWGVGKTPGAITKKSSNYLGVSWIDVFRGGVANIHEPEAKCALNCSRPMAR
jgi:hypothetical protein